MDESLAITWRRIPERYRLEGSACSKCSSNFFPPRKLCPTCRRKGTISAKTFCGKGKIYSFTEIFSPPGGFELEAPYTIAIVQLEEGPKITAQITAPHGEIKIGDPVEMVFRKIQEDGEEGLIHYGFKFRLVK
ncbi:Uncharacterised protein [Candidatus Anstonella stagnisolia]|nr:Uncharacterised protein [Candidatus Anstonella stagnisolia]